MRFIRQKQLLSPGDRVIAAVSGGADSVALLDILANLPGFRVNLVVAHLNHSLRAEESDGDEKYVRTLAEKYQLPLETSRVDVAALAVKSRLSLEEAGREARYAFFDRIANKYGVAVIATAHHKDDQAETVLMRLLRGSAGSGLAGIRPKSPDNRVIRPLLCISRQEIEAYLGKGGIPWREDSSNSDQGFLRNRIRHELLPLLHDYNPEVVERLNSTAEAVAADETLLANLTTEAFARCQVPDGPGVVLDLNLLLQEAAPLRSRLYRQAIRMVKGDLRRISFRHLEAVGELVQGNSPNGHLDLPDGLFVTRSYASLTFSAGSPVDVFDDSQISIDGCGSYPLPCGKILHVESVAALPSVLSTAGGNTVFLDPVGIPFPWFIRYFRPGDRFVPLGMRGHKKLKDLFIDRKVPTVERYRTPLLLQNTEVVWVCGLQLSEKGRLSGGESNAVRVTVAYTAV